MATQNDITITITFPLNVETPIENIQHYTHKFCDHIDVIDISFEREWLPDKSCVKLYGKEKRSAL